jgi:zinc transport system substrate-binding protein
MTNFIIIALLFLSLSTGSHAYAEKIKVIASIAPLADFAKQIGGEQVEVTLLLPPGASPHIYEPTPKTLRDVSRAKIFIKVGSGLEFWAEKIIKASGNKNLVVVIASSGIPLIQRTHSHHPSGVDPHIWLDPTIARTIVTKIEKALIEVDPPHSELYRANASVYKTKLSQLDREIAEKVKAFKTTEYVTFHPAWNYFSKRYGLSVAGVIVESPGKEPGPKHIAQIVKEINRIGSRVIFVEPQFNPKIAEAVARECNAEIVFLDPIGGQHGRETYVDLMRYNISAMERVMK